MEEQYLKRRQELMRQQLNDPNIRESPLDVMCSAHFKATTTPRTRSVTAPLRARTRAPAVSMLARTAMVSDIYSIHCNAEHQATLAAMAEGTVMVMAVRMVTVGLVWEGLVWEGV